MDREITLKDFEEYIDWYRKAQLANPGEPQAVIQPSVLESFVKWFKSRP